jgi:hypothetical protein
LPFITSKPSLTIPCWSEKFFDGQNCATFGDPSGERSCEG